MKELPKLYWLASIQGGGCSKKLKTKCSGKQPIPLHFVFNFLLHPPPLEY